MDRDSYPDPRQYPPSEDGSHGDSPFQHPWQQPWNPAASPQSAPVQVVWPFKPLRQSTTIPAGGWPLFSPCCTTLTTVCAPWLLSTHRIERCRGRVPNSIASTTIGRSSISMGGAIWCYVAARQKYISRRSERTGDWTIEPVCTTEFFPGFSIVSRRSHSRADTVSPEPYRAVA